MRRSLKSVAGRGLFATGAYRHFLRDKATVVLFHRVDDRLEGNPISCTSRFFRDFCVFAKNHFDVISLGELLDRLEQGRDLTGCLTINFDDGYLDNFAVAAPILRELGLPACFFVATDFIGSDRIPFWDEAMGIKSEWMSWDQVRALRDQGFELGCHTRNHVDLGSVSLDEAREEIVGSRQRLESELDQEIDLFSYPFGRATNITEECRELVRSLGFRCCPSAYGGVVRPGTDPFRMERQPISPWHVSPWQFGLELARV